MTDYGFYYGTITPVTTGNGTKAQVGTSDPGTTAFSLAQTGLTVNTHYFFATYAVNSAGTTLDSSAQQNFWTLASTTPPTLSGTSPANNATNVLPAADLVATFNETIVAGTGSIELRRSSDASLVESFDVTSSPQLAFSTTQLIIQPTSNLITNQQYYVLIPFGAVKDTSGNSFAGITNTTDWNFTVPPPVVLYIDTGSPTNPPWILVSNTIVSAGYDGANYPGPVYGSLINVNNAAVEVGLYGNRPISVPSQRIHVACNTSATAFANFTRWFQTDGNTQILRVFVGDQNTATARTGVSEHNEAYMGGGWNYTNNTTYEWTGHYTVAYLRQGYAAFQLKNTVNDWAFQLSMGGTGALAVNNRYGTDVAVTNLDGTAKNVNGGGFDMRVLDDGQYYKVWIDGVLYANGSYPRPTGTTTFRWGMYYGANNLQPPADYNMIFVSGAQIKSWPGNLATATTTITKANNTANLDTGSSWVGGVVPGPYNQAVWDSTVAAANTTTLASYQPWAGLKILNPGGQVTINGSALLGLGDSGVDLTAATQNLAVNCPVQLTAPSTWGVAPGRTATFNGIISGYPGLTLDGGGTLLLGAVNTYGGATTIGGGTLQLGPVSSGTAVTIANSGFETPNVGTWTSTPSGASWSFTGAGIDRNTTTWYPTAAPEGVQAGFIQGAGIISQSITVSTPGGYVISFQAESGTGALGPNGIIVQVDGTPVGTWPATAVSQTAWGTYYAAVSLTPGSHTLAFVGNNTMGGNNSVAIDNVQMYQPASYGALPSGTAVSVSASGATLDLLGASQTIGSLAGVAGSSVVDNGSLIAGGDNTSTSFAGTISGSGALTKAGSGTLSLSATNTYTGATTISGGTLQLGSVSPGTAVTITNFGFETPGYATYQYGPITNGWIFSSIGGFDGNDNTFHAPSCPQGTNCAFIQGSGLGFSQFVMVPATGVYVISFQAVGRGSGLGPNGIIVQLDGTAVGTWPATAISTSAWETYYTNVNVTAGSHTLAFVGNNTIGGDKSSSIDNVQMYQPTTSYGTLPSATDVNLTASGATLDLFGSSQTIGSLAGVSGTSVVNNGSLTAGGDNTSTTFAGAISGSGALTKVGSGTLTLSGANTYTGNTTINAGTLAIGVPSLAAISTILVANGAVLQLDFATTNVVAGFITNGVALPPGVYNSGNAAPFIAGSGSLNVAGITAPPQPTIGPVIVSGTNLVVSVSTVLGANYVLQSATNLTPAINWQNESTNAGTDGNLILNVPIEPGQPQKFLRFWVY